MANFFTDNEDLKFTLKNLDLREIVRLRENDYKEAEEFDFAPENFEDALDSYERVLQEIGHLSGERIEPRSRDVDLEGPEFKNNQVTYHPYTKENLEDLRKADVCGVMLPRKHGGLNYPVSVYTMMTEMVSRADASLQNLFGLQDIAETISEFGTEEQKRKYLPRLARGEADGSMDLTEPDSGSDLQSVRLKATYDEEENQWYLDGMKRFITNGCSQIHLVLARSEPNTSDGRGLSMFICEKGPELVVRRIEDKLGIHGVATCELQFNHVPAELCGKRKRGLTKYVMSLMNGARIAISAQALGIAEAAYREAQQYASEREQFNSSIDKFPAVYSMLTNMKMNIIAARTLLYETTRVVDHRSNYTHIMDNTKPSQLSQEVRKNQKYYAKLSAVLTPMTKAFSTEMANKVTYDGIQVHGGPGYMKDFNAERFYRDARITNIYEGTTQLQHVAAIGGIVQRVLDPLMDEYASLQYEGKLKRLLGKVNKMRERRTEAINFVNSKKDSTYHELMTENLVNIENYVFISYLLLKDAKKNSDREIFAERFIIDAIPEVERNVLRVLSDDVSLIDNHKQILDY